MLKQQQQQQSVQPPPPPPPPPVLVKGIGDRYPPPVRPEGESGHHRSRERAEAESDRCRTRDRLEATLAGLGELDFLKQRQEYLVRGAMELLRPQEQSEGRPRGDHQKTAPGEICLTPEEKQLEDNILMLRKQLNCLRRRDAGLINQLQELDRQISDLRLDVEKAPNNHLETDSRPSSGFYELSDGTSGSLSNSSNSVFSECLSSCRSSTCFCSPLDASLSITDGRPKSAEDLIGWRECGEGLLDYHYVGAVRRSFSAPYSSSLDVVTDVHPKYQCDLVSKNGGDIYRYPSPLHAVAVQSPIFFHPTVSGCVKEEEKPLGGDPSMAPQSASADSETAAAIPQSSSWPTIQLSTVKRLDNYIFGLIQKKTQPVRPNKPRTSLNPDPLKGILRQSSVCVRQTAVIPPSCTEMKAPRNIYMHSSMSNCPEVSVMSPQKQQQNSEQAPDHKSAQSTKAELISSRLTVLPNGISEPQTVGFSKKRANTTANGLPALCTAAAGCQEGNGERASYSPKDNGQARVGVQEESSVSQPPKIVSVKGAVRLSPISSGSVEERPALDFRSEGSSVQSLEDSGHLVNAQYIPGQQQVMKSRKGIKNVKIGKVKNSALKPKPHCDASPDVNIQTLKDRHKAAPKKCRFSDDVDHMRKTVRKTTPRVKRGCYPPSESSLLGRHNGVTRSVKCNGSGREVVLVKPRYKQRVDYRRWKSTVEVTHEEALKRLRRRNRREALSQVSSVYVQASVQQASGVCGIRGSDSEYSAECESLFHSTVADTSEDEQSNYTTNCFGDSESSLSEVDFVGETTSSSDSDESGGLVWPQFGQPRPGQATATTAAAPEMKKSPPKAFVKIKASHNLKKKILRFRSGSLKLMTTV